MPDKEVKEGFALSLPESSPVAARRIGGGGFRGGGGGYRGGYGGGNSSAGDGDPTIFYIILGVIVGIFLIVLLFMWIKPEVLATMIYNTFSSMYFIFVKLLNGTLVNTSSQLPSSVYKYGFPVYLIFLALFCFTFSFWYIQKYASFTSTAESINELLSLRRNTLGAITSGPENKNSVCLSLTNKVSPYSQITSAETPLVNWRPLTVRLAGYLGGIDGPLNGVFDMDFGISNAIFLGARSFIFDIDYLEDYPCVPVLVYQDASGTARSLNTASIKDGMAALSKYAFGGDTSNYDPVIIVLYLRRVPKGIKQKKLFYTAIAQGLNPISADHLGSTEQGNFHNCMAESHLFTTEISNFQKKFIVLSNHNSSDLPAVQNPKDNLDFWTNARLHKDTMGKSSNLSSVVPSTDSTSIPYATIGDASQLLMLSTDQKTAYAAIRNVYKIAICPLENLDTVVTVPNLSIFLNVLGINSIPLDVLSIGAARCHNSSIVNPLPATLTLEDLANGTSAKNTTDPLSFWSYAGWSKKLVAQEYVESFANYVKATPIPGFIIPKAVVPKKPSPSTNSNGGLVSIA